MSEQQQVPQHFDIQKVYLKDVSLETPNSPLIFTEQWQPQSEVRLETGATPVNENLFEVVLTVTITSKLGERTAYLTEVQQAGLFTLRGFDDAQLGQMLHAFCPNLLFPFAREELSSLIGKAGFPALLLNPINFDAIYLQRLQQQQQAAAAAAAGAAPAAAPVAPPAAQ
ncbi:MAG: protein-export chaperone SecB [Candidatus Competibacteraceae bacterium]|jgi:preprotein translocase subunit SecB|nr:MAG: protein-export chaperone SecB [Candidatus Competibacteraceae bacterium]